MRSGKRVSKQTVKALAKFLLAMILVLLIGGSFLGIVSFAKRAQTTSIATLTASGLNLRLPWPSGSHQISGYSYNCGDHHTFDQFAVDFGLNNQPLSAVFSGTIRIGQYDGGGYGNNIWVDHGDGHRAIYAHLGSDQQHTGILVTDGQPVIQGQVIAISGSSGNSSGPHLHFSLRYGGSDRYDGTQVVPEPMSGYYGFGDLKNCVEPSTSYTVQQQGGWWSGSTPADGSVLSAGTTYSFQFYASDSSGSGLRQARIIQWYRGESQWQTVTTRFASLTIPQKSLTVPFDFKMPAVPDVLIAAEVTSLDGTVVSSSAGIHHYCDNGPCIPYPGYATNGIDNGPYGSGGGDPTPTLTPSPTNGFQVCQNTNYGQPCEVYHYTSHDTCISLDQMAGHNKSVEYLGDYVNGYSAVMYHDNNCGTYLARYDSNNPDIGWGLYDQFSSMRLEQHMPPDATQVSPINGATLPSGTTETDVSFSGTAPFTLHVWDLTTHFDVWQPNITAMTFHISGLQDGATYNWQIIGNIGPWSGQWSFSVANAITPSPSPTIIPTSVPTQPPTPTSAPTISLDSVSIPNTDCLKDNVTFTIHGSPVDFVVIKRDGAQVGNVTIVNGQTQYTYTDTLPSPWTGGNVTYEVDAVQLPTGTVSTDSMTIYRPTYPGC